jgi:serine/threonine-protein kinase
MKAYTLYLKARFFWDKRSKAGINRSIELFTQAAEIDPNYALALSGLSDAYTILAGYGWSTNKKEDEKNAKDYAVRALEIDSNLAEAHTSLGFIYCYKEWKWEEAEKELSEAMRLNPNYAFAFHIYSLLQDIKGDHFKAREVNELALQLDPLSIILHYVKATLYYNEGNFEKSLNECKEIMDLEPECPDLHVWFFKNYYRQGNGPEALHELQIMLADNKLTQEYTEMANQYYIEKGLDGLVDLIVKITDEIKLANPEDVKKIYWEGYLSDIYAIAGEKEEALAYLEHYLETNSNGDRLVRLINNPDYIILRSEPRFKAVLNKLGLMEYYKQALTNTQAQAK